MFACSSKVPQPLETCAWSLFSSAAFKEIPPLELTNQRICGGVNGLAPTSFCKTILLNTSSKCAAQAKLTIKSCWVHLYHKLVVTFMQVVLHLLSPFFLLKWTEIISPLVWREWKVKGMIFLGITFVRAMFHRSSLFNTIIYPGH